MLKRILLTTTLFISCHYLYAQYVSPNQLSKIYNLWHSSSPDSVQAYIYFINPKWLLDRNTIKRDEDDREASWLYLQKQPFQFGNITVATLKTNDGFVDKVIYFTNKLAYYQQYVEATKASKFELINYTKQDDGTRKWVYGNNGINYILSISPPNSKGLVIYTMTVQGYNTN